MDVGKKSPFDIPPQNVPYRGDITKRKGGKLNPLEIIAPQEKIKEKLGEHLTPPGKEIKKISDLAVRRLSISASDPMKFAKDLVEALNENNLVKALSALDQIKALDPTKQEEVVRLINDIDVFSDFFAELQKQVSISSILNSLLIKMYEKEGVIVACNETDAQAQLKKMPGSYVLYPTLQEPKFRYKMITQVGSSTVTIGLSNNSPREIKKLIKESSIHMMNQDFLSTDQNVVRQSQGYMRSVNKPCFLLSRRPDGALTIDYRTDKHTLQGEKGAIQQKQIITKDEGFAFADNPKKTFLTIDKLLASIGLQRNDCFLIRKQMILHRLDDIAKLTPDERTTYINEFRHYLDETTLHQLQRNADPVVQSFLSDVAVAKLQSEGRWNDTPEGAEEALRKDPQKKYIVRQSTTEPSAWTIEIMDKGTIDRLRLPKTEVVLLCLSCSSDTMYTKIVEANAEQRAKQILVDNFLRFIQLNQYDSAVALIGEIKRQNLIGVILSRLNSESLSKLLKDPRTTNFLHEGILAKVKQEGHWCENDQAMAQALTVHPDEYFVRPSSDPHSWTVAIQHKGKLQPFRIDKTVFIGMQLSGLSPQALRQKFIEQSMRSSPQTYYWTETPVRDLVHACLGNSYPQVLAQLMNAPSADASRMKVAIQDIIPFITAFNPTAAKFLQRVVADYDAISNFPDAAKHKLTPLEMLRISVIAETALATGGDKQAIYLKRGTEGLSRGLLIDFKEKRFFILSKKRGKLQASGTFKKVDDVIGVKIQEAGQQVRAEARHFVRVINKKNRELDAQECAIEQDVSPEDVHLILNYTKTTQKPGKSAQQKTVMIQEAQDGDLCPFALTPHSNADLLSVFSGLGESLKKLHAKGYIHGDLKLANALFRRRNGILQVKISDFGFTSNPNNKMPRRVLRHGTTLYTAPERISPSIPHIADTTKQGQAEDVFALGCMMYEMLFQGQRTGPDADLIPWAPSVYDFMEKSRGTAKSCYDDLMRHYEALVNTADLLPETSLLRSYLYLCANLLDPSPHRRPTAAQYHQRMLEIREKVQRGELK